MRCSGEHSAARVGLWSNVPHESCSLGSCCCRRAVDCTSIGGDSRVAIPLTSMEQLVPFPTAQELVARKKEPLLSVHPAATVLAAVQLMADKHVGFLPVIENGVLVGVVSERD